MISLTGNAKKKNDARDEETNIHVIHFDVIARVRSSYEIDQLISALGSGALAVLHQNTDSEGSSRTSGAEFPEHGSH